MVLDVLLSLFLLEWDHPLSWDEILVVELRPLKHMFVPVRSVMFVGVQNVFQISDYHIAQLD
jgi:hypothetical protein